jgi:nickel/cobalt transporter (NicO) family protein
MRAGFFIGVFCLLIVTLFIMTDCTVEAFPQGQAITEPSINWFTHQVTQWQISLNKDIATKIRALKNTQDIGVLFAVLGIAFTYGVVHSVGPGHRQIILTGWVIAQPRSLKNVALASTLAGFLHTASSAAIVVISFHVMGKYAPAFAQKMNAWLDIAAATMLILMGFHIIYEYAMHAHKAKNESAASVEPNTASGFSTTQNPFSVAFAVGAIPCPLAVTLLLFSTANVLLWQAVLIVLMFATGLAASNFLIAACTWFVKYKTTNLIIPEWQTKILHGISIAGAISFIIIGLLFLMPYLTRQV